MAKIKIDYIEFQGAHIPLSIPVEMEIPTFINDNELDPKMRQDLLLFNIIQEQLKTLNSEVSE